MTFVLEINDWELTLYEDKGIVIQAPAIAAIKDGEIIFGKQAAQIARLIPKQSYSQYFSKLNTEKLTEPAPLAKMQADLVYLNLKDLLFRNTEPGDDLIISVSSSMSNEKLGILLGIIQQLDRKVVVFVDSAIAAIAGTDYPQSLTHYLDVGLHSSCVTEVAIGTEISKVKFTELEEVGFTKATDLWANDLADRLVKGSRFDPLHSADTEQQLYNQIYKWVDSWTIGDSQSRELSLEITIKQGDNKWDFHLAQENLEKVVFPLYQKIVEALPDTGHVTLSHRTAKFPGFSRYLSRHGYVTAIARNKAIPLGCIANKLSIRQKDTSIRLINSLKPSRPPQNDYSTTSQNNIPTHFLDLTSSVALPMEKITAVLQVEVEKRSTELLVTPIGQGIKLNDKNLISTSKIVLGDVLAHKEETYSLVLVEG